MMTIKPERKGISGSLEDYLEAIWFLSQRQPGVHNKDIARELGVKMPSVTAALQHLKELGYIDYDRRTGPKLTQEGECLARQVADRHALLKDFFASILLMPPDKAEALACSLEHTIGQDAAWRLANLTTYLKENCFSCKSFQMKVYQKTISKQDPAQMHVCTEETHG